MLKKIAGYFTLIADKTPPAATMVVGLHVRKSNVVILTLETVGTVFEQQPVLVGRIFHPGRSHGCCRSAPQGAHHHAGVIFLIPLMGIKMGARSLWCSELNLHELGSRQTVFILRCTTHPNIQYQVCANRGAWVVVLGVMRTIHNLIIIDMSEVSNIHYPLLCVTGWFLEN